MNHIVNLVDCNPVNLAPVPRLCILDLIRVLSFAVLALFITMKRDKENQALTNVHRDALMKKILWRFPCPISILTGTMVVLILITIQTPGQTYTSPDVIKIQSPGEKQGRSEGMLPASLLHPKMVTSGMSTKWTWQNPYPTGLTFTGVAYGRGLFVSVSALGMILTSPDGYIWRQQNSGVTAHLTAIRYVQDTFIAVGSEGTILTSSDATTWVRQVIYSTGGSTTNITTSCSPRPMASTGI